MTVVAYALGFWFVLVGVVYSAGWSFAWVRRGFKRDASKKEA